MICFNKASITEIENKYISDALNKKLCGDGEYTKKVHKVFADKLLVNNLLLTTSCSHALDMTAILAGLKRATRLLFRLIHLFQR